MSASKFISLVHFRREENDKTSWVPLFMQRRKMASINDLPAEVKLHILSYVNADDVWKFRQVSKNFNGIISSFPFNLQRVRCCVEAVFDNDQKVYLKIRKSGNANIIEVTEDNFEIIKSIEIINLRVNISADSNLASFNDRALEKLFSILLEAKQQSMRIIAVKGLQITNESLANKFLDLVSTPFLQELNLSGSIANYLTAEHVSRMQSICQLRLDDNFSGNINAANAIIEKFAYDIRHKSKINIPFVAEINTADPSTILSFIQEWICLPETPYFQIKFTNFSPNWLEQFNDLCDEQHLSHIFYEFSSKMNRHAHIKIKFHEESNEFMIFPIKDVPARNLVNQYICYARYCRDF